MQYVITQSVLFFNVSLQSANLMFIGAARLDILVIDDVICN